MNLEKNNFPIAERAFVSMETVRSTQTLGLPSITNKQLLEQDLIEALAILAVAYMFGASTLKKRGQLGGLAKVS